MSGLVLALPPALVGDSEDSDEFDVERFPPDCAEFALSAWETGWGTKMTETQLSSESREVSLWMLESLLLSEPPPPASPLDSLLSLTT